MRPAREWAWEHHKAHNQGFCDGFEEHGDEGAVHCLESRFRQAQAEALQEAAKWARERCDNHLRLIREGQIHDRAFAEGVASGYGWTSDELSLRAKKVEEPPE